MRGWLLGLLLVVATAPACESDPSPLAKGSSAKGGAGGGAGRGGGGSSEAGFPPIPQTGGAKATGTGGRAPDEAPGETVLTFLHGIVDAERVLLCFVAGRGADARVLEEPAVELGYGEALVLRELAGASLANDDIEPLVITGELELVSELGCAEALTVARAEQDLALTTPGSAVAGAGGAAGSSGVALAVVAGGVGGEGGAPAPLPDPPRLRVGELPVVPAGTLGGGRSYLLVGNGCVGGPAFAGRHAAEACGEAYSVASPTLSAVLVALSRRSAIGKLGMQVVHASVATSAVDLTATRLPSGESQPIVSGVQLGGIVPPISQLAVSAEGYGADSPFGQVQVRDDAGAGFVERWSTITARAGLSSLVDGSSYTLVVLGPNPWLRRTGFWNPRALAVVRNDPSRPDPGQ